MTNLRFARLALVGALLLVPATARAQDTAFAVDEALAARGNYVWKNNGCMICHRIGGGRGAGPDLRDLFQRRSADWVRRFLKHTDAMVISDSVAMAMVVDYRSKMPQIRLSDRDIWAVMHYIARENERFAGR